MPSAATTARTSDQQTEPTFFSHQSTVGVTFFSIDIRQVDDGLHYNTSPFSNHICCYIFTVDTWSVFYENL